MSFQANRTFTAGLVDYLRDLICSDDLLKDFRCTSRDFIRNRILTFARTIVLLFTGQKMSLQTRVNKFFVDLGETTRVLTSGGYSCP